MAPVMRRRCATTMDEREARLIADIKWWSSASAADLDENQRPARVVPWWALALSHRLRSLTCQ